MAVFVTQQHVRKLYFVVVDDLVGICNRTVTQSVPFGPSQAACSHCCMQGREAKNKFQLTNFPPRQFEVAVKIEKQLLFGGRLAETTGANSTKDTVFQLM